MAGILNKKERVFDYILTEEGLSQIQKNDLRFVYASISDASINYDKNFEKSKYSKVNIDGSLDTYLPLESSSRDNTTFSKEFKLNYDSSNISSSTYNDVYLNVLSKDAGSVFSDDDVISAAQSISIGTNIKSKKILLSKSDLRNENFGFKVTTSYEDNILDFKNPNFINRYNTLTQEETDVKNLDKVINDKRFSNKLNFNIMVPLNSAGESIFSNNYFVNKVELDKKSNIEHFFTSLKENININDADSRIKVIKDTEKALSYSEEILKKVYDLIEEDSNDTFFIEMFEINESQDNDNGPKKLNLEKLLCIHLESFYDESIGSTKDVYLIGKMFYNDKTFDLKYQSFNLKENIKSFNAYYNTPANYQSKISALSQLFSFVCMFVLVAE